MQHILVVQEERMKCQSDLEDGVQLYRSAHDRGRQSGRTVLVLPRFRNFLDDWVNRLTDG